MLNSSSTYAPPSRGTSRDSWPLREAESPRPDKALFYRGRQRRAQFIPRSFPRRETARDGVSIIRGVGNLHAARSRRANARPPRIILDSASARGSHLYNESTARSTGRSARGPESFAGYELEPTVFPRLGNFLIQYSRKTFGPRRSSHRPPEIFISSRRMIRCAIIQREWAR